MPELAKKEDCTGCTACASACPKNCIRMVEDNQGFLYPEINLKYCIGCNRCVDKCPICSTLEVPKQKTEAFAAYTNNDGLREGSSSGGMFSEIALEILRQGGVVFGVAYDEWFDIQHICVKTEEELERLRGAKYAQSTLDETFACIEKYLKQNCPVLFSGTPCQVSGLRSFLKKDYDLLMCVDFVCHGVPSPAVWKKYIEYRSKIDNDGGLPVHIDMRSKQTGWSRYKYSTAFQYKEKKWSCLSGNSLYMKLFVGDYINRLSCSNCHVKGYNRVSDITLGDFWGIWEIAPEMDDNKGTSLILLHSDKARRLFQTISSQICYKPVSLEEASFMNHSLLNSSVANNKREEYIEKAVRGEFDALERELMLEDEAPLNILQCIKGKLKRIVSRESN